MLKQKNGVYVQIRPIEGGKSKMITLYGESVETVYNRLYFLYRALQQSNGEVRVTHYET